MTESTEIRQLSLVAYYDKKDTDHIFWKHIKDIQSILKAELPNNFEEYDLEKIHATIIGLEGAKCDNLIINKNYLEKRQKKEELKLEEVIKAVRDFPFLPSEIKIGGFKEDKDEIFTSRGLSPYQRSFSIQSNLVVVMGWPFCNDVYSPILDTLRRKCSQYGALHKYHATADSYDNDFFFVIGTLKDAMSDEDSKPIKRKVLEKMQEQKKIQLTKDDLRIVAYKDTKLIDGRFFPLKGAIQEIDTLYSFYPEYERAIINKDWLKD